MTDRQAMKTHILNAYKARDDSDLDALMSAFHPDAVFKLAGQTTIVEVAGEIRGCSNIRARMAGLIDAFKFSDREIVSFIADGERAAVHCRIKVAVDPPKRRLQPICSTFSNSRTDRLSNCSNLQIRPSSRI